jgi:hypothetical protein
VLEQTARIAYHCTKLELDRLKMGIYPLAADGLKGA